MAMANKVYLGQLMHFLSIAAVESHDTDVDGVKRIGVRAPDLEDAIGNSADTTAVTDPAAEEASQLGLLRGLLTEALAILEAMPTGFATADNQTTANGHLATLAGVDFATQTTLTAILAKIIAAPATEAKQDTGNGKLDLIISALAGYLKQVIYNSSGTEILTETDPGTAKISDAGIVIPTDKQAIYRNLEVDYSTALGVSGSYTSSAIDGLTLRRVTGTVYADQAGTLNIQESKDGTTYRITATQAITASTPYAFDAIFHSRYLRLNYVNDTTAQGAFELVAYSAAE
jgi:hypothetical protein